MMNHTKKERSSAILIPVYNSLQAVSNALRLYTQSRDIYVELLPDKDLFGESVFSTLDAAYVFSGQAGILDGFRYPLYGRYTNWMVEVLLNQPEGADGSCCEVILNALGKTRPMQNLSERYSIEQRNRLEEFLRKELNCGPAGQIT